MWGCRCCWVRRRRGSRGLRGLGEGARRPAFAFVFVTVMLDMLGFGIVTPVLPGLIAGLTHGSVGSTSRYVGLFISVWAVMQFFCSPVLGLLSDRFGRRPVILLNTFGLGLDYFIMALAPTVGWLFVARVLSGVSSSTMATANAYVADITAPEGRAKAVRAAGRGAGDRVCPGAGAGRLAGRDGGAAAVLGVRGDEPAERGVWVVCLAGIVAGGEAADGRFSGGWRTRWGR